MAGGVSVRLLLAVGGVTTLLSVFVTMLYTRGGALVPVPPIFAYLLLMAIGAGVLAAAWPVRTYLAGRRLTPLDPFRAARALAFAQAGAITGAAVAGWYLGQLFEVLTNLSLHANRVRTWPLALAIVLGVGLAVIGMVAQRWCRLEPPKPEGPKET